MVTYAAAIDVAKGSGMVCTRVPGSRPDRKRQTVWQVDATYAVGDRADGSPAVRGYPAAGAREHLRLLADLLLPGRGRGPGGVAGQRQGREAPARPGQIRPGRQRVAVQAERAGDAAPLVRAAAGDPRPAVADPHPVPAGPGPGPAPEPGREDPRGRAAEDLGGDLRPVRRQRAAVPGRPGRRRAQPGGAGRARRPPAARHSRAAGRRAHRPVPRGPRLRDRHPPAADRHHQRRDRPAGHPDRAAADVHPRGGAGLHQLRADRRRALAGLRRRRHARAGPGGTPR